MTVNNEICNAFNTHARTYEQAAKIDHEIGERLFERLQYLKINPRYILDLGCGPGRYSAALKKYYPNAKIVGLDLAFMMLNQAQSRQGWFRKWSLVNGDMMHMPFSDGLFDLVFANQVIHWGPSLPKLMAELNRVMNTNACLMFSTLGPDTFFELKKAWSQADSYAHTFDFADMHDLGDILLSEHFEDPVVDMEKLHVHYPSLSKLLHALRAQGVRNTNSGRNPGLTGKKSWQIFASAMDALRIPEGKYPLTYEVVYGHAWKGQQRRVNQGVETIIPIDKLRRSRRS